MVGNVDLRGGECGSACLVNPRLKGCDENVSESVIRIWYVFFLDHNIRSCFNDESTLISTVLLVLWLSPSTSTKFESLCSQLRANTANIEFLFGLSRSDTAMLILVI